MLVYFTWRTEAACDDLTPGVVGAVDPRSGGNLGFVTCQFLEKDAFLAEFQVTPSSQPLKQDYRAHGDQDPAMVRDVSVDFVERALLRQRATSRSKKPTFYKEQAMLLDFLELL